MIYLEKDHFIEWGKLHLGEIRITNSKPNHFFDEATCCWNYLPENFILLKIFRFSFNLSQHSVTVRPFVCIYAIRFTIKCYKIMLLSCCTLVENTPLLLLLLSLFYVVCYVTLSKKSMSNYCEMPAKVSYEQQKEELMRPRNVPLRVAPSAEFYVKCLLQQKP